MTEKIQNLMMTLNNQDGGLEVKVKVIQLEGGHTKVAEVTGVKVTSGINMTTVEVTIETMDHTGMVDIGILTVGGEMSGLHIIGRRVRMTGHPIRMDTGTITGKTMLSRIITIIGLNQVIIQAIMITVLILGVDVRPMNKHGIVEVVDILPTNGMVRREIIGKMPGIPSL